MQASHALSIPEVLPAYSAVVQFKKSALK